MFSKVLIANRGEIALRIARACRELGIRTVAVYSTDDRDSAVVGYADEAIQIGPGAARRSYLSIPAIVEAARRTSADAIHPGYGFLSEEADFAEVCQANGLIFIGPRPEVIRRLGDKTAARALMADAGLPILTGSPEPLRGIDEAQRAADSIGYPVIIKTVTGGGGRGMRVARERDGFARAFAHTRASAQTLSGDGRVYVEKYLDHARHVEVQILADQHGNIVHLGERDCSVQRRHQKLLEETPAPGLPAGLADRMGHAAVLGARAAGYTGAGTVEFLVDARGEFSFIEVNCRIQVEHPVTEMATGVDLVQEQFRAAAGEVLTLRQPDVLPRGSAIECRINLEDPERNFAPTPGLLTEFSPAAGPFVRVDTHGYPGYRVPATYDSLLAKLVVWAPTREQAVNRMRRALAEFRVNGPGIHTTTGFLSDVINHPLFQSARHTTAIVERVLAQRQTKTTPGEPGLEGSCQNRARNGSPSSPGPPAGSGSL
ncbi:MAG: acetyl-CoA carboxylase biotin carboxylase subunit [Pseudonocardiaceae bacterium]